MRNYFRMLLVAAVSTFLLSSGPTSANAADEGIIPGASISANVAIVNEYRWRGLDQSATQAAIQGGFDLAHSSGLYIGTWLSNVDFGQTKTSTEFDYYGGFGFELSNGLAVDLNVTQFAYPGSAASNNNDFVEYGVGLSKDFGAAALSAGFNFSSEFFGESGDAQYLQGGLDVPLPILGAGLSAHVGHQWIDKNSTYGVDDYTDWSVGLTVPVMGVDLGLTYVDTDLDISTVTTSLSGRDAQLITSLSKSF
jgi:uncharacterized protein (TIGR02001 family)